jgi:RND family efflux transporter MFP subunit
VDGQVATLLAKVGDSVKQNQPILQLDTHIAQANLAEKTATRDGLNASLQLLKAPPRAEALKAQESSIEQSKLAFDKAQAAVDRLRPLSEKQQIPPAQLYEAELAASQAKLQREAAEAQLQAMKLGPRTEAIAEAQSRIATADATLDSAQVQFNLFTLKSPIDGVLNSITCRLGQTLSPGSSIGEVVDSRQLIVVVWLPARDCARVKIGQAVEVVAGPQSTAPAVKSGDDDEEASDEDAPLAGKVIFVGRVADAQTGNLPVHVSIENIDDRFAVGQVVSASITVNEKAGLLAVPVAALVDVGEGNVINVVRDGKSQRAQPELGIRDKTWVEISGTDLKEPLKAGELVIVEGGYNLPDGTAVSVKSGDSEAAESSSEATGESPPKSEPKSSAAAQGDPP